MKKNKANLYALLIVLLLNFNGYADESPVLFDDACWLRNDQIQLAFSPKAGRIVWFGKRDAKNLLFIPNASQLSHPDCVPGKKPHFPKGGDKLWPAYQGYWIAAQQSPIPWPPDDALDGQPWKLLQQSDQRITVQSSISKAYGIQATRTISLTDCAMRIQITNHLTRVKANPFPVMCWTITQVQPPDCVLMDASKRYADRPVWISMKPRFPITTGIESLLDGSAIRWPRTMATLPRSKVGTFGTWMLAQWGQVAFLQWSAFDRDGAYPDASNVQAVQNVSFTEMELLSPSMQLHPGQSLTQQVTWQLLTVKNLSADKMIRLAQQVMQ